MGSNRSAVEGMDVFMEIWLITVCISFMNSIKSCRSGCSCTVNATAAPLRSRTGVLGGRCSEDRLEVRVCSHLDRLDLFRNEAEFPRGTQTGTMWHVAMAMADKEPGLLTISDQE